MTVAQTDVVRATVDGIVDGQAVVQNVFHLQLNTAGLDEADALDDIVEILEILYQVLNPILTVLYVIRGVRVINATQNTSVGEGQFVDDVPGINVNPVAPPQVAYGLTLTTPILSVRGRKFFGPVSEGQVDNTGLLSGTALTACVNAVNYMAAQQVATNGTWSFGVIRSVLGGFGAFNGGSVSARAVTQRRRRVGVGI